MKTSVPNSLFTLPISLTPEAWKALRHKQQLSNSAAIRLGVRTTGCSGLSYTLEAVAEVNGIDQALQQEGAVLLIDTKSQEVLRGVKIDYVDDGIQEGFVFENPNAKGSCGCGESFTV